MRVVIRRRKRRNPEGDSSGSERRIVEWMIGTFLGWLFVKSLQTPPTPEAGYRPGEWRRY